MVQRASTVFMSSEHKQQRVHAQDACSDTSSCTVCAQTQQIDSVETNQYSLWQKCDAVAAVMLCCHIVNGLRCVSTTTNVPAQCNSVDCASYEQRLEAAKCIAVSRERCKLSCMTTSLLIVLSDAHKLKARATYCCCCAVLYLSYHCFNSRFVTAQQQRCYTRNASTINPVPQLYHTSRN
eukprot:15895-Heterococcus_DN1.PRE.1